jgi:hypothetical protein
MLKTYSINRLLVLTVTAGFAFLAVDTAIEHWDKFSKEFWVYLPVLFSAAGVIIGAVTVVNWKERWIRALQVFLYTAFIVAAAGMYFHNVEGDDEGEQVAVRKPVAAANEQEKEKPPLASLAFGGLAIVGLLGTSRKWEAEVIPVPSRLHAV